MAYYLIYMFRNFNAMDKLKKVQLKFVITIIST